jgi:hypothetical protein
MRLRLLCLLAFVSCGPGSSTSPPPAGAMALYDPSGDFFARPWPSDDRLAVGSDGKKHFDLTGFTNPGHAIGEYLTTIAAEPLDGYGVAQAVYFRFDAPIDATTLPQSLADSVGDGASVYLIGLTPSSPDFGKRVPSLSHFAQQDGLYIGKDWLAIVPAPGFPLREQTTYAAVVTDRVRAADGGATRADARFPMPADPSKLALPAGASLVSSTTFTTGLFTPVMKELRDAVYAAYPGPPTITDGSLMYMGTGTDKRMLYDWYEGTYVAPNFQEGDPPYTTSGGRLHVGPDGKYQKVRDETLTFAVTIPRDTMPDGGWPVVLYAHGTGGTYHDFIDDGSAGWAAQILDENANVVARAAMISIYQVLHGPRAPAGTDPDLAFYNLQNIAAAHDNVKQGALDDFQLLRLVENVNIAAAPMTNAPIKFDKTKIYFKGHSQGAQTGSLFLPFETDVKAAVLSGGGANLTLGLLGKTSPLNIPNIVEAVVGESVDLFHPLLNIVQAYMDSADPATYARLYFREPPSGVAPKSIYESVGLVDTYTPLATAKALALAMGAQPADPMLEPIDGMSLRGLAWAAPPIASNVAGGAATAVVCEYKVPKNQAGVQAYDGHFVVFQHPAAAEQSNAFLGLHMATGTAKLVPYMP